MAQHSGHPQHDIWSLGSGWSTITADNHSSFTLWFTGLPGTGKTTLALLVKKALVARGYKVEIIDTQKLSHWLSAELQIHEDIREDASHTLGYDAFITYICSLLTHNGIISITTSVSPYQEARLYAREQLGQFIEVYLHCSSEYQKRRIEQQEHTSTMPENVYQPPERAELSIDTSSELPERSALRTISYLEQHGYIAPLWEAEPIEEEVTLIKARLQALGYLE